MNFRLRKGGTPACQETKNKGPGLQRASGQLVHQQGWLLGQMWALWCSPSARQQAIRQARQIGQGVSLTMKYDGLTGEDGSVTCFQTLHLEAIILLDASYNL